MDSQMPKLWNRFDRSTEFFTLKCGCVRRGDGETLTFCSGEHARKMMSRKSRRRVAS